MPASAGQAPTTGVGGAEQQPDDRRRLDEAHRRERQVDEGGHGDPLLDPPHRVRLLEALITGSTAREIVQVNRVIVSSRR